MTKKRRTKSERRAEREAAGQQVWLTFRWRLEGVRSFKDALLLHSEAPAEIAPGRKFYSNLGFFLTSFRRPGGSNSDECALYLAMLPHFEAEGAITSEARKKIEAEFW